MKLWMSVAILWMTTISVCWARASVSHVTPENVDQQRLGVSVVATPGSNSIAFIITISAKTNAPLPAKFSANARVKKPNVTSEQIALTEAKGDDFVQYSFSVVKADLVGATFFFGMPARTDTPMPPMGHRDGSYYHIDLLPFAKTDRGPNKASDATSEPAPGAASSSHQR